MWIIKDIFSEGRALIYCEADNRYRQVEQEELIKLYQEHMVQGFHNYAVKVGISKVRNKIIMVSDIEAFEYAKDNPDTDPYVEYEDGNWVVYYTEEIEKPKKEVEVKTDTTDKEELNYIVFTITDYRSYLYLKEKGGVTYILDEAKHLTEDEAISKAKFATEHSHKGYTWKHMKIR